MNRWCTAFILAATVIVAGCSGTKYYGSAGVGYSSYYGHGHWDRWYDRPVYVVPPDYPDLPDEPIAVPLPEPPPDIGGPDVDFGGFDY